MPLTRSSLHRLHRHEAQHGSPLPAPILAPQVPACSPAQGAAGAGLGSTGGAQRAMPLEHSSQSVHILRLQSTTCCAAQPSSPADPAVPGPSHPARHPGWARHGTACCGASSLFPTPGVGKGPRAQPALGRGARDHRDPSGRPHPGPARTRRTRAVPAAWGAARGGGGAANRRRALIGANRSTMERAAGALQPSLARAARG